MLTSDGSRWKVRRRARSYKIEQNNEQHTPEQAPGTKSKTPREVSVSKSQGTGRSCEAFQQNKVFINKRQAFFLPTRIRMNFI